MSRRKASKKAISVPICAESSATFMEAVGTKDPSFAEHLLNQVLHALWLPANTDEKEANKQIRCVVAVLQGIKPQNELEGLLATQMIVTHNSAMECLQRAATPNQSFEGRDMNLKHATKLLSIFAKLLETLNRHRGKGQQKVTVEYVHVQAGGQAIVGQVEYKPK